ncbi:hypothetical protein quinque_002291 [Culex quinquefasciatus]
MLITAILVTSSGLVSGPRLVVLHRHNGDFGFTLRHFIVYPPPDAHPPDPGADRLAAAAGMPNFAQPMDTVFVKKVHPNSPAFLAGLQEGDRLLAVNGLSVASLPYAQVVATIQQTPKTLTLQVVPKNYDLLQTYFSETAYNPETNQRPQPQQLFIPKASSTPTSHHRTSTGGGKRQVLTDVQEKQESLYSTLQEIVESAVAPTSNSSNNKPAAIYAEVPKIRSPPIAAEAPKPKPVVFDFDPVKQQQYLAQQQQQKMLLQHSRDSDSISSYDSVKSAATLSANDVVLMGGGDSAIMSRLRKSFEQKEEFLRRPAPAPTSCAAAASDVQQREFYGRPNRLQKSVWPPPPSNATMPVIANESNHQHQHHNQQDSLLRPTTTKMSSGTQTHAASLAAAREQHSSAMSAIREQFFAGTNGEPKSAPPSLLLIQQNQQLSGSQSALPLSPASMHVVSEKAKLFESGRPLSPDGVDRAELYKSELSRMNPKQVVPNVAVRRKEFELKAESTGWRRSTEEKPRSVSSDSESRRTPVRVRSLSVESSGSKDPMASLYAASTASSDDQQHSLPTSAKDAPGSCSLLRQRPVRENSYRHAVRNSTAFWLQGPATAGSFVPPPSALSPPPSSAPPTHGHLSHFSFPTSSSSSSPPSSLSLGIGTSAPVPPARTYAAAHRLQQPFSEEQFRLKLLHRNQTIVEVHSQPGGHDGEGPGGAGSGFDADVDMQLYTPPAPPLLSSSSSSCKPLSVVPEHGDGGGRAANVVVKSGGTAPMVAPVTTPVRPTTLNLCSADSNQVVLRQKQQPLTIEEDERKTRRISYLRATAHDNLLHMMESSAEPSVDSSPMSLPPDTPDTEPEVACGNGGAGGDQLSLQHQQQQQQVVPQIQLQPQLPQQLKSAYRPWRRPRFNTDIQPLRRLFDESAPGGGGQGNLPPILESQQPSTATANNSEPTTPTTPTNREFDDPSKFAAIVTDSDGEVGEEPAVAIRSAAGQRTAQKRSASLTTTSLGGAQLTGSSLGNLHVITTTSASGIVTRSYFFAQSHSAKSKALAHFRDAPADPSVPVTREGELNVKVTLIDGKRSQDRSWRTVHAELRGTRLRLTLLRDGKSSSSQVSRPPGEDRRNVDSVELHVRDLRARAFKGKETSISVQATNRVI